MGLCCLSKPFPPSRGKDVLLEAFQFLGDFVLEPTEIKIFAVVSLLQNHSETGRCVEEKKSAEKLN